MSRLKQFIHEIHRRSLWQVLMIYLGASWAVLEVSDQVIDRYLLPEWVYPAALILLLIGLPIVLATAFVREERREAEAEPRDPTLLVETLPPEEAAAGRGRPIGVTRLFTWPRAILGGALAFLLLGLVSALVVVRGMARVTEAQGAANEAFEERAWVIVANFESAEEEADIALAAQTAFTLDLQQSEYVNVRGSNQIIPVLVRMGLPDTTSLGERRALEVAEREGISAVVVGSVSRLGRDFVFGARVVQPGTGEELITVKTVARDDRMLEGVESLSREVRRRLGEERGAIRRSRPLPEVTTESLEALKVYARGQVANNRRDFQAAAEFADEAMALDSTFAMAHRLAAVAANNQGRASDAMAFAASAYELRDRLTDRERLYVEAAFHFDVSLDMHQMAATYENLLSRYPDEHAAHNNLGIARLWLHDLDGAYRAYREAVKLSPYNAISYGNALGMARITNRWEAADSILSEAEEHGLHSSLIVWRIEHAAALGDWDFVDQQCDSVLATLSSPGQIVRYQGPCGAYDLARGKMRRGTARLEPVAELFERFGAYMPAVETVRTIAESERLWGRPEAAARRVEAVFARYPADRVMGVDRLIVKSTLLALAGELGRHDLAERVDRTYSVDPGLQTWAVEYTASLVGAATALSEGDPARAIEFMREARSHGMAPPDWAYIGDVYMGLAFDELGEADSAVAYLERAANPGYLPYQTISAPFYSFVVLRLAEVEERRGNTSAAAKYYQQFLHLWSDADPELQPHAESARRALSRLTASESI